MIAFDLAYELSLGLICARLERSASASVGMELDLDHGFRLPPRPHQRPGSREGSSAVRKGWLASLFLYVPISLFGLALWPGWQSMYLVDLDRGPIGPACVVQAAALLAAYGLGARLGRAKRYFHARWLWLVLGLAWATLLAVLFIGLADRAFILTSFADFHSRRAFRIEWGTPSALLGSPLMYFLLASGAVNGGALLRILRNRRLSVG